MLSWKFEGENEEDEAGNVMLFCFALYCTIRNGINTF